VVVETRYSLIKQCYAKLPHYETLLSSLDEGVRFSSEQHSTEDKGHLQGSVELNI